MWWPQNLQQNVTKWEYYVSRARDVLPTASLWGVPAGPNVNDVDQGINGDCYFLATISSIAEHPERIKSVFLTQDYNPQGIIAVKGEVIGIQREIVIDDYLPFSKKKGQEKLAIFE